MADTVIAADLRHIYKHAQMRSEHHPMHVAPSLIAELIERVSKAEAENAAFRAERQTILDSVTRHCTPEQISAITADILAARGREGE